MEKSFFTVTSWQEAFVVAEKIAHANAEYVVTGSLSGQLQVNYSLFYDRYHREEPHQSSSRFKGFMFFEGIWKEQPGSLILEDCGSFINGVCHSNVRMIEHSGTGVFKNMTGQGIYYSGTDGMILELVLAA